MQYKTQVKTCEGWYNNPLKNALLRHPDGPPAPKLWRVVCIKIKALDKFPNLCKIEAMVGKTHIFISLQTSPVQASLNGQCLVASRRLLAAD